MDEQEEPRVATTLREVEWFEAALEASNQQVERTPEEFRPAWYRKYESANGVATSH